jgi:alpha-aminoadipic semialdehyde synthase
MCIPHAGFGGIMGTLSRIGFFNTEALCILKNGERQTFQKFLLELLRLHGDNFNASTLSEKGITERIIELGLCKERETAVKTAKTIM